MKKSARFLVVVMIESVIISFLSMLFVLFFFRVFPEGFSLIFPGIVVFGAFMGVIIYLPFKYFIEKP